MLPNEAFTEEPPVVINWQERDERAARFSNSEHAPDPRWLKEKEEAERDAWQRWA
jgi:hypothetical protein